MLYREDEWSDTDVMKAPPIVSRRSRLVTALFVLCLVVVTLVATELEFLHSITLRARENLAAGWKDDHLDGLDDYECVGWQQTDGCTPDGEPKGLQNCSTVVPGRRSGYCEIRHRNTGELRRVLKMHCDSVKPNVMLSCANFSTLLGYGHLVPSYLHDLDFSFKANQRNFHSENIDMKAKRPSSFARGIIFVVNEHLLPGAYASIRNLRDQGCTLPIELWSRQGEIKAKNPIVRKLLRNDNVFQRVIYDEDATKYFTKLYAVFYSAFDSVLLLDADNFPVRDPEYLFDTPEYKDTGALFWPDYRRPARRGLWDIIDNSILWEVLDMPYVDMFEQESGQVVIDRRRHLRALNALMFFGFHRPRVMDDLKLVWGDKDLFRLAWLKTNSTFYWSARPAGSAGRFDPVSGRFCGGTIVQHDPAGELLFLHRNARKLRQGHVEKHWTHIEQFKVGVDLSEYTMSSVRGAPDFPDLRNCYGEDKNYTYYDLTPIEDFPFADIEDRLIMYFNAGLSFK